MESETRAALVSRRDLLKGSLNRIAEFAKHPPSSAQTEQFETRLHRLEEIWLEFSKITENLYKYQNDENYVDPRAEFHDCEDLYLDTKSMLKSAMATKPQESNKIIDQQADLIKQLADRLNALECGSTASSSTSKKIIKKSVADDFPNTVITPFSGEYKDWPLFEELFQSALQTKPKWANKDKMNYLKSLLRGNAANLIQHMPSSNDNYETAWKRLKEEFDRPIYVVHGYIEQFMNIANMKNSSVSDLRKIITDASDIINRLDALHQNERDPWLVYILMSKLDAEICHKWLGQPQPKEKPTIKSFLDYLDECCNNLTDIRDYYKPSGTNPLARIHPINYGKPLPCTQGRKTTSPAASIAAHSTQSEFQTKRKFYRHNNRQGGNNNNSNRGGHNNGNRGNYNGNRGNRIDHNSTNANVTATISNATTDLNTNTNGRKDQSQMNQSGGGGAGTHYNPFRMNQPNMGQTNQTKMFTNPPHTTAMQNKFPNSGVTTAASGGAVSKSQSVVTNYQLAKLSTQSKNNTGAIPKQTTTNNQNHSQPKTSVVVTTAASAPATINQIKPNTDAEHKLPTTSNQTPPSSSPPQQSNNISNSITTKAEDTPSNETEENPDTAKSLTEFKLVQPLPPPPPALDSKLQEILKGIDAKKGIEEIVTGIASEPNNRDQAIEALHKILREIEDLKKSSSSTSNDYSVQAI